VVWQELPKREKRGAKAPLTNFSLKKNSNLDCNLTYSSNTISSWLNRMLLLVLAKHSKIEKNTLMHKSLETELPTANFFSLLMLTFEAQKFKLRYKYVFLPNIRTNQGAKIK